LGGEKGDKGGGPQRTCPTGPPYIIATNGAGESFLIKKRADLNGAPSVRPYIIAI
jgi:hypothetical protein